MMQTSIEINKAGSGIAPRITGLCTGGLLAVVITAMTIAPAIAQQGAALQQKLADVKKSTAENQQKLHRYQWMEITQLTLKGEAKPAVQSMCMYGPDGKVQKTLKGAPPPPPSGGRIKQRIIAKKKGEMKDYMGQLKTLLAMYLPPNPERMQQAFQSGKASLQATAGTGIAAIVFKDYAEAGDQMTLNFDTAAKKISSINVNTYMDEPKDIVTLVVRFASLPDGTNYVQRSVLDATAKKLVVTTTNSDYQLVGAH